MSGELTVTLDHATAGAWSEDLLKAALRRGSDTPNTILRYSTPEVCLTIRVRELPPTGDHQ